MARRAAWLLVLIHLGCGPASARAQAPPDVSGPIVGRVVEDGRGRPAIATPDGRLIAVANPEALRNAPIGPTLEIVAEADGAAIKVGGWKTAVAASWGRIKGRYPVGRFPGLHDAADRLDAVTDDLNRPGLMGAVPADVQLGLAMADLEAAMRAAYASIADRDSGLARDLCREREQLRRERRKAIYNRDDNYRPEVYRGIYENTRAAVAIVHKRGELRVPRGSGVLIGKGLVLTAAHCVNTFTPDELEAWFDFSPGPPMKPADAYAVASYYIQGERPEPGKDPLDFALIRIAPMNGGRPAEATHHRPTLSTLRLRRDDALYVLGYPGQGNLKVHDNAFVLFPYRVTAEELLDLRMFVCAETQQSPDRGRLLAGFLRSYRQIDGNTYLHDNPTWRSPIVAADCDTFHGDSGGGAFERTSGYLVGLLLAGQEDAAVPYAGGWRHHEAILPIEAVLKQVDARRKGWREEFDVRFAGGPKAP